MSNTLNLVDGKHMIGNYQTFPIYSFNIEWKEKLENGKFSKNATHHTIMYKEEQNNELLQKVIDKFLVELSEKKKVKDIVSKVELIRFETWCITWFSHYTFDLGQTDKEVKDSFEEYVKRHEHYQNSIHFKEGGICLMGAEDRYRWHSHKDNEEEDYEQVPCRCIFCKEQGILRINH